MFSAITVPNQYMHGYAAVPLQVVDTESNLTENYQYIINVTYDKKILATSSGIQFDGQVFTRLNFSDAHEFKVGEVIFLTQASGLYTGYYTIAQIISSTSIVIDLPLSSAITGTTSVSHVIPYLMLPSPDGDIKEDLSYVIRNKVRENTEFDSNDCFAGDDTRFDFDINLGHKGQALFTFYDNVFSNGNVGFINSGITATTQTPFQIGDQIIIQQDLYSWDYTDNFFKEGYLAFTGLTNNNFFTGDTVTVTGQITQPYYNGPTTVVSAGTGYVVVNKTFTTSTPAEPGTIFGIVTPQYNTTATITNIYVATGVTGVIIETSVGFSEATQPIGGTIKHIDGRLIDTFNEVVLTGFSIFNSALDQEEYTMTDMNQYVVKNSGYTNNNFSTLLSSGPSYRIEQPTKSWLLLHNYTNDYANGVKYVWRNSAGNVLGASFLPNISSNKLDFYAPVGIDQLLSSTNRIDTGATLISIVDSIATYSVEGSLSGSTQRTNPIYFELNNDCSMYDMYHLMWKDKHGSWLSYPFKYMANVSEDTEKKSYYKSSGRFSGGQLRFNTWDRGQTEFHSKNRGKIRLNSGIVEQSENEIIKDLFDAAHKYVQLPNGDILGCSITNNSLPLGDELIEGVFNYTFDIQLSNNKIRL